MKGFMKGFIKSFFCVHTYSSVHIHGTTTELECRKCTKSITRSLSDCNGI